MAKDIFATAGARQMRSPCVPDGPEIKILERYRGFMLDLPTELVRGLLADRLSQGDAVWLSRGYTAHVRTVDFLIAESRAARPRTSGDFWTVNGVPTDPVVF